MITADPEVPRSEFEAATGWALKPEGACRGEVCIPLPRPPGATVDLRELAPALRMPLVHDAEAGWWALGPSAGPLLDGPLAPDFELPDISGGQVALSSLRGRKVAVVAWAPW